MLLNVVWCSDIWFRCLFCPNNLYVHSWANLGLKKCGESAVLGIFMLEHSDFHFVMFRSFGVRCFSTLSMFHSYWTWIQCFCNDPSHEIMVLFVFRKLILQTRMRSHQMGLDVWFWLNPSSASVLYVCEQRRLWWVCTDVQARLSLRWSPMW